MHEQSKARRFASDLAAGAGVGAALAWALATLFQVPMVVAFCAAGVVFLRVFCSLRRKHAGPRFALPPFQLAGLEFEADGPLELDSIAASIASGAAPGPAPAALPTVKQMQESIRLRLSARDQGPGEDSEHGRPADAADELRAALRNLRRSIG
jgi:hypothetical protein